MKRIDIDFTDLPKPERMVVTAPGSVIQATIFLASAEDAIAYAQRLGAAVESDTTTPPGSVEPRMRFVRASRTEQSVSLHLHGATVLAAGGER